MSLETEDQRGGLNPFSETSNELQKKPRISYTRDFLLSLSELDVSKKLPSGFDQSLLSEDTSQDRYRIPASLSSQNLRRNEYGSSPPTRGDSSNYPRGIQGRWDSRSSSRSDRDSDSQSEWDSDSGRRYGNMSRRPWQVPEHDGLLGSGSFPRPSGYAVGPSAPKFRANDQLQLSRSNEPYHPPRPYKAVPHSRRETNDSYNDETFGSSEFTSEDRAEEERKRRASFESMRKEQQKAFQEKQKSNPEKCKGDFDITLLMEDSKDGTRISNRSNVSDEPVIQPLLNHDSSRPSFPSSASVSRPLFPPGFFTGMAERNNGLKSPNNLHAVEVGGNELEGSLLHTKGNRESNETLGNQEANQSLEQKDLSRQQLGCPSVHVSVSNKSERIPNLSSASDVSAFKSSENSEVLKLDAEDVPGNEIVVEPNPSQSASILEKLFGSAATLNGGDSSRFIEHDDVKADGMWDPSTVQSSKFAQWFSEDEKKQVNDLSAGRPNDLLSLIVGSEKDGCNAFNVKANEHALPKFSAQSSELAGRHTSSNLMSANVENSELLGNSKKSVVASVLTCEDLEQSILSEITKNNSNLPAHVQCWSDPEGRNDKQKVDIDDRASQHLLSLLQKGRGLEGVVPSANLGARSSDNLENIEVPGTALFSSRDADAGIVPNSGKPLTLETLFGSAFMKELQSGAAASDHRGSVFKLDGSELHGLPFPSNGQIASSISSHGSGTVPLNLSQQKKSERIEEHLPGFDHGNEVDSSLLQTELGAKPTGFDGTVEIRLPEEDSLISVNDPPNQQNFIASRNSAKAELLSIPERPIDITGKLVALNPAFRDERSVVGQDDPPFLRGPYDMREPDDPYHNLRAQPSSPQLHSPQLNHTGPMFHPLDSRSANINAQMKFMAPDNMVHRDTPSHQFPANMLRPPFQHASTAPEGFDPTAHHSMLQQMHRTSNFSLAHLLRGLPRGAPPPPHPNNHMTSFMQEPNPMQGFHLDQRQPNYGGLGFLPQAVDGGRGSNHPEALQRLVEMELRSNSKQVHPFDTVRHGPGMYGHELDMGFGYR